MKISIVTPSLNQGLFVEEAILSVVNQGYEDYEHIIVDGGSQDNTLDILKKYSFTNKKIQWISEPDRGQSDALNKGFRMATGNIIGWLNADDRYLPGCFDVLIDFFHNNPEVDVVYGDYRFIDEKGEVIRCRKEIDFDISILKYLHVLYIPSTATFFRRRIVDEGNFLREDFHYAMDYEFFLRLALKGYKFMHIPKYFSDFRWHRESKSTKAAYLQKLEHEKALMELDPFLHSIRFIPVRQMLRKILLFVARANRTGRKILKGAYWAKCP